MSDTRNGARSNGAPEAAEGQRARPGRGAALLGLLSAAVFVALFYLWGEELLPRAAGRLGTVFPFVGAVALTLAVALFLTEWFGFAGREVRKVTLAARDFLFLCFLALFLFFLAKFVVDILPLGTAFRGIPPRAFVYLIPLPACAMVVRVLLNSEVAIIYTVAASVLSAAAAYGRWPTLMFLLLAGTAGASRSGRIQDRYRMLWAGVQTAPICALAAVTLELAFHGASGIWWAGLFGGINGLVAGPLALAILPVSEYAFGYASDIRLMEFANAGHPLLARLLAAAPGTFHHSVLVGTIAEGGAVAIHANPLLCRVAALFHDVGKIARPEYFSENQTLTGNVHDDLAPAASREAILAHVTEGVRLAREHRLGDRVTEIIAQHHGTSVMYFFLDKASSLSRENGASEASFRYPGPRPRTREAAIVMLADAAEAASRSLRSPSPAEIDGAVTRIVNRAYLDGQLNECDMTLRDLHAVGRAFTRVLAAAAHSRVEYPPIGKGPAGEVR